MTGGAGGRDDTPGHLPGPDGFGHPVRVASDDDSHPPASDLSSYRRARQERTSDAMITLFATVLGKPLERRELTPHEQARREARKRARNQSG